MDISHYYVDLMCNSCHNNNICLRVVKMLGSSILCFEHNSRPQLPELTMTIETSPEFEEEKSESGEGRAVGLAGVT